MSEKQVNSKSTGIFGSILGGTLSLTVSTLAVKVLGLIYKIPLARILTDEGMGYFNSAYTVFGLFYLLCTAGVPKAVMILCSENADEDSGVVERTVRIAMGAFFLLGLVITAAFAVFAFPIAKLIGNSGSAFTMLSIAPSILFISLGGVLRGYLSSRARYLDIAVSGVIEGVAKLVLGLIFGYLGIRMNMPLQIISAMTIFGTTLGAIFSFLHLYICAKSMKSKYNLGQSDLSIGKREIISKIFKISIPITLSSAVMSLTNIIDLSLVMRRLTDAGYKEAEASALYGNYTTLAVSMFNFALSIITPISIIFLPHLTRARAARDNRSYKNFLESALRLVSFLAAPMTFGLAFYSYEILSLIFGMDAAAIGAPLLTLIAPAVLFSSMLIIINTSLEASGKVKAPIYSMLVGSVIKILVGYFLIGNQRFGIVGAPLGTVASYLAALIVSMAIAVRETGISLPIISSTLPSYLIAGASVTASKALYFRLQHTVLSNYSFVLAVSFCALIYLAVSTLIAALEGRKISLLAKYTNFA